MGRQAVITTKNVNIVLHSSNLRIGTLLFDALGQTSGLSVKKNNPADARMTVDDWMLVNRPAHNYSVEITLSGISPSMTAINQLETLLDSESWKQDVDSQLWVMNPDTLTFFRFTGVAYLNADAPFGEMNSSGIGEIKVSLACHKSYNSGISKYRDVIAAITGAVG